MKKDLKFYLVIGILLSAIIFSNLNCGNITIEKNDLNSSEKLIYNLKIMDKGDIIVQFSKIIRKSIKNHSNDYSLDKGQLNDAITSLMILQSSYPINGLNIPLNSDNCRTYLNPYGLPNFYEYGSFIEATDSLFNYLDKPQYDGIKDASTIADFFFYLQKGGYAETKDFSYSLTRVYNTYLDE